MTTTPRSFKATTERRSNSTCKTILRSNLVSSTRNMVVCCRCNRSGTCKGCACVKAKKPCENCLPGKLGNCANSSTASSTANISTANGVACVASAPTMANVTTLVAPAAPAISPALDLGNCGNSRISYPDTLTPTPSILRYRYFPPRICQLSNGETQVSRSLSRTLMMLIPRWSTGGVTVSQCLLVRQEGMHAQA